MNAKCIFAALLLFLFSERGLAKNLSHPLRAEGGSRTFQSASTQRTFPDTIRALAILVQFQSDNDPLTTGTGQFDLSTAPQRIIDAPPRDSAYFADHLLFAENYFRKASNGKENITATLLPTVLTLSKQMSRYAPLVSNLPLAQLIEEAWKMADSVYPSFPFQNYNFFVVFHAGSGKDIDLRGSIGYDPTPYDLPSLYFGLSGLKNIFGSSYAGIALANHPGFLISNSALLPETENRLLPSSTGDNFLYQLGINGLIVADVGSYLGLPDLFDTKTGGTAIGRFGLMDGQAIFSFSGLFPPEPSAWEKIFLGWTSAIGVPAGDNALRLPAAGVYQSGGDTIYRVPISAKEYFLLENRDRDAHGDGVTLTIRWNGQQFQRSYSQDDDHFNAFNVDSIYGNVVDVDEFDWSLPGARGYLGGTLIWHIDERVIEANFALNSINADPAHRGVDLEEADGSQDLGQSYGLLDAGAGTEDGSPIDYWYAKNISPVYKNEFSESSNPNSLSNSGAHSHISIRQFSDAAPVMTLRVTTGDERISLLKTIKRPNIKLNQNDAPFFADLDGNGSAELVFTSGDSIYVLKNDLTPFLGNPTGLFSPFGGRFQPAKARYQSVPSAGASLACVRDSSFILLGNTDGNGDTFADSVFVASVGSSISTPVTSVIGTNVQYYLGDQLGRVDDFAGLSPFTLQQLRVAFSPLSRLSVNPSDAWTALSHDSLISSQSNAVRIRQNSVLAFGNVKFTYSSASPANLAGVSTVALFDDNTFSIYDAASLGVRGSYRVSANVTGAFALADVNGDGEIDILIGTDNGLYGYNMNGVPLENYPLKTLDGGRVAGSPIVARLAGSNSTGVLFGSTNGQLLAYDQNGKMIDGFPLQTGGIVSSLAFSGNRLAAASTDSSVYVWQMDNILDSSKVLWKGFLADEFHSNYVESSAPPTPKSTELLPASYAYNWPNPVREKSTNIRYFLGRTATVTIKIFNMAGELVEQLAGPGAANLDNEVAWDVSKVQSGVYFAQIKATASGEEKSVIVKIAVVK